MSGASIQTTPELWASSPLNVKSRIKPLLSRGRVAASGGLPG
jgi:hypothetical protein